MGKLDSDQFGQRAKRLIPLPRPQSANYRQIATKESTKSQPKQINKPQNQLNINTNTNTNLKPKTQNTKTQAPPFTRRPSEVAFESPATRRIGTTTQ